MALGMCFVGGCTPSTNTPPSPTTTEYTVQFVGGNQTESVSVEAGKTVSPPAKPPTKDGYKFNGWDFDFSTVIESDTEISAKWLYYSNASLDLDNVNAFVGAISIDEELGTTTILEENGKKVLSATCNPTKQQTLTFDFDTDFPLGTKIVFKAKYESDLGGAVVNVNGEYYASMPTTADYQEYEVLVTEDCDIDQIAFRPTTESVAYTFTLSEMYIITNMETVDFNEFSPIEKAFEYNVSHSREVIFDESEQTKVLAVTMKSNNAKEHLSLQYTQGVTLPAGSKIYVRMWYKSLTNVGGGCLNLNTNYQCGWGEPETWETYVLTVDRKTELNSVSLRPYNPSAKYVLKISSVRIEYATD